MTNDGKPSIALIEPDPATRAFLYDNLTADSYSVIEYALCERWEHPADVLILDTAQPEAFEFIGEIRQGVYDIPSSTAILALVVSGHDIGRIRALQAGADDAVSKPFSYAELLARVVALLRRKLDYPDEVLEVGPIRVDPNAHCAIVGGEHVVPLTPSDMRVLRLLMRHPYRVFTKEQLGRDVWGFSPSPHARMVDNRISRLRLKLGEPRGDRFLINVWGVGYRLLDPQPAEVSPAPEGSRA